MLLHGQPWAPGPPVRTSGLLETRSPVMEGIPRQEMAEPRRSDAPLCPDRFLPNLDRTGPGRDGPRSGTPAAAQGVRSASGKLRSPSHVGQNRRMFETGQTRCVFVNRSGSDQVCVDPGRVGCPEAAGLIWTGSVCLHGEPGFSRTRTLY